MRLADTSSAPSLAATLVACHLEATPDGGRRLLGVVELRITETDQSLRTRVLEASEPVEGELPGNLAVAMARLMRRLAAACLGAAPSEA